MIKYTLNCHDCHESFDAWFRNSSTYDDQESKNLLECSFCGSHNVSKGIMAPSIKKSTANNFNSGRTNIEKGLKTFHRQLENMYSDSPWEMNLPVGDEEKRVVLDFLRKTRKHIENNFENVGDRFVDEAVAITNGDAEERDIYGTINKEGEERLAEEGIPYAKIPWVPREDA